MAALAALVRNTGLAYNPLLRRGVAQPGRALSSGGRGRWFESSYPDHCFPFKANCIRLLKIQARSQNSSPGTQLGRNLLYFTKNDACTDRLPSQTFTIFSELPSITRPNHELQSRQIPRLDPSGSRQDSR